MSEMRKLTKFEVERMLNTYDQDPLGTLSLAISLAKEVSVTSWTELVQTLGYDETRTNNLRNGQTDALDELLKSLVEDRSL
jgi:hypothetical protein